MSCDEERRGLVRLHSKIVKSPMDPKKYEIIKLANGIQCIIISSLKSVDDHRKFLTLDPETGWFKEVRDFNEKIIETKDFKNVNFVCHVPGACANEDEKCQVEEPGERDSFLLVKVAGGTFHDKQPGVAHLTEHAVLLGSKKFPEPDEWLGRSLLTGGELNATTGWDDTQFNYVGKRENFEEFVDRLSDLIANPILDEEMIKKEIYSVDSEFASRVTEEELRIFHLVTSLGVKNHPVKKFSCGNLTTLDEASPKHVVEFHQDYYKAQNMQILMAAPFPLDQLERMCEEYFGKIQAGRILGADILKQYKFGECPFTPSKDFNMIYRVVPLLDKTKLNLTWSLPPSAWQNYRTKPLDLIHTILSYRGHGGFIYILTKLGWLIRLSTGFSEIFNNEFNSFFNLLIELTPEGIKHLSCVLAIFFSYLNWLRRTTKCELAIFFEEMRIIKLNEFHYDASTNKLNTDALTKINLNFMEPNEILLSEVGRVLDFDAFKECLNHMKPSTCNYIVYSKNYEELATDKEPLYGAKYSRLPIPQEILNRWEASAICEKKFHFPKLNPYIPKGHIILPGKKLTRPKKFEKNCKLCVVYKHQNRSREGDMPTAEYTFTFRSANLRQENPRSIFYTNLWIEIMNFELVTRLAHASLASVGAKWSRGISTLILKISGAAFKLHEVFDTCLSVFKNFENCEHFHILYKVFRERLMSNFKNDQTDQLTFAIDILTTLTFVNHVNFEQLYKCGEKCTFEKFVSFIDEFKTTMFVDASLDGTVIEWQFNTIITLIRSICFKPLETAPAQSANRHVLCLPIGKRLMVIQSRTPESNVSLVLQAFCCGVVGGYQEQVANNIATKLYIKMFKVLRTDEQIAFKLGALFKPLFGIGFMYIYVYVQSDRFTTGFVRERVTAFYADFYNENYKGRKDLDEHTKDEKKFFEKYIIENHDTFRHIALDIVAPKSNPDSKPVESQEENENKRKGKCINGKGPKLKQFQRYPNVWQKEMIENDLDEFGVEYANVDEALDSNSNQIIGIHKFLDSLYIYPNLPKEENDN